MCVLKYCLTALIAGKVAVIFCGGKHLCKMCKDIISFLLLCGVSIILVPCHQLVVLNFILIR